MRRQTLSAVVALILVSIGVVRCRAQAADPDAPAAQSSTQAPDAEKPKPEDVLRKMADYLGGLPALACHVDASMHVQMGSVDNAMVTKATCRMERPRRLAMIIEEGLMGTTTVCDGKQLLQFLPATNRYVVKEAPEDLTKLIGSPELASMTMGGMGGLALPVGGDAFYQQLMTGVTSSDYVGLEKLGDVMCDHCRFVQERFDWDIWIEKGDRPVIHKIVPDISKELAQAGDAAQGAKMEMSFVFSDWNVAPKFTDADFAFTPPSGARKAVSLFGGVGDSEEESLHPLIGQAAPPFKAKDLAGQEVDLSSELGKHVVILDFWATWCGPCCQALPIINDLAAKYKDRGVVFHAVNLRDEADTITEFLKSKSLDVPVVLDADGAIGDLYKAEAIPQTVLIDTDGKVQVVHVGMSGGLADELSKQLDDLLAGKDLAAATFAEAKKARESRAADQKLVKTGGATMVWTIPGKSCGVAVDPRSGIATAVDLDGRTICVDVAGKTQREFRIEGGDGIVRSANLARGGSPGIIAFNVWGPSVTAYSSKAETLWNYPGGQGVDDVWAADLHGDGLDEVIVGYNGSTGLHVLDPQGKLLWKSTDIANVWHVSKGDFSEVGKANVISTAADGKLHVFDVDGHKLKDIDISFYAEMVRMAPALHIESPSYAIVAGSGDKGAALAAVDFGGDEKWQVLLPTSDADHVDDLVVAATAPWAAVAMRGGIVYVIDLESHERVGCIAGQGTTPQLAWLPRPHDTPLLLVATGRELSAFEIVPTDLEAAATAATEPTDEAQPAPEKSTDSSAK